MVNTISKAFLCLSLKYISIYCGCYHYQGTVPNIYTHFNLTTASAAYPPQSAVAHFICSPAL